MTREYRYFTCKRCGITLTDYEAYGTWHGVYCLFPDHQPWWGKALSPIVLTVHRIAFWRRRW